MARGSSVRQTHTRSGQVRIIAGRWRGRRLDVPNAPGLRPTPDRVRETLFNWLQPCIEGSRCLDLFAGTGVLGLEALSRGSRDVVFVERNKIIAESLHASGAILDTKAIHVVTADALQWLQQSDTHPFDIVFLDPPYDSDLLTPCSALLEKREWLAPGAMIYLEGNAKHLTEIPDIWQVFRSKKAGQVGYYLARRDA